MHDQAAQLLEEDCTRTSEQLAAMANMPVEEVKAAVKQYEAEKVILGYQAIVDWNTTDRDAVTALIEVKVTPPAGGGASTASPSASTSTTRWRPVSHVRRLRFHRHYLRRTLRKWPASSDRLAPLEGRHRYRHPLYPPKIQRKST